MNQLLNDSTVVKKVAKIPFKSKTKRLLHRPQLLLPGLGWSLVWNIYLGQKLFELLATEFFIYFLLNHRKAGTCTSKLIILYKSLRNIKRRNKDVIT